MNKILLSTLLGLTLAMTGFVGCQNATSEPAQEEAIVGTWVLSNYAITFPSTEQTWSVHDSENDTTIAQGTWSRSKDTYTLKQWNSDDRTLTGEIQNNTLTLTSGDGRVQVYTRQGD